MPSAATVVVVGAIVVVGAFVVVVVGATVVVDEVVSPPLEVVVTASSIGIATAPNASIAASVSASPWGKKNAMPSCTVPSTSVISGADVSSTSAGTGTMYRARSSASARAPAG